MDTAANRVPPAARAPDRVAQLVIRYQSGDVSALRPLVRTLQPSLLRIARRIVRDPAAAEDVFMIAIARLLERLPDFESPVTFHAYSRRTARNAAIDFVRVRAERDGRRALRDTRALESSRPPGAAPLLEALPARVRTPEGSLAARRRSDRIRSAVDGLSDPARTMIRRHYFDGLSYREIAEEAGVSAARVKRVVTAARLTLAARLKGLEVES